METFNNDPKLLEVNNFLENENIMLRQQVEFIKEQNEFLRSIINSFIHKS